MKTRAIAILLILPLVNIMVAAALTAAWIPDGVEILPYPSRYAEEPVSVSDGSGGSIVVWIDDSYGNSDIYAQRIDSTGSMLWLPSGIAVCTAVRQQTTFSVVQDGSGGAIVAWDDYRSGSYDIYAQRIIASGAVQWATDGVPVCTVIDAQGYPKLAPDGSGGAIVAWSDYRLGNHDIYAQRINASGAIQWTVDGVPLCTATDVQAQTQLVPDGSGGAIVTWRDNRGGNYDIYAQRVSASGSTQWTANGVPLCTETGSQSSHMIVSDNSAGAIVAWQDYRSGNNDIYVQRINAVGEIQWTANGVALCTATGYQNYPGIVSDGSGGAIVAWYDKRSGSAEIYAQRIDLSGAVQWMTDGVLLCTAIWEYVCPRITTDGSGGAIVAWRGGNDTYYAQRINSSGAVQWAAEGVVLITSYPTPPPETPSITSDGAGGAIVTIEVSQYPRYGLYAQRVNSSGAIRWTADGACVAQDYTEQISPQLISDAVGGAIVTWKDNRTGEYDIYARRVSGSGTVQWTTCGITLCAATGDQIDPMIVSDGMGGAIVAWEDDRTGSGDLYAQIYAQRVSGSGAVQWASDGVLLCTETYEQCNTRIVTDGEGGAIVVWENSDFHAQRVNSSGEVQWTVDGVTINVLGSVMSGPEVVCDGAGGVIVTWAEAVYGESCDIFAQRVSGSGTLQWGWGGVPICEAGSDQLNPRIISAGIGGAIVTWEDGRSGNPDLYAQRINSSGAAQWTVDGVPLCAAGGDQTNPQIVSDGAGGAIVMWEDDRGGDSLDIYAQRVNSSGTAQWTVDGVPLCAAIGDQTLPVIESDGAGGAIAAWQDYRSGNNDIYAQRVNGSGLFQWAVGGVPVCVATGEQFSPVIESDGSGGVMVTWPDLRDYTNTNGRRIFIQRITDSGLIALNPVCDVFPSSIAIPGEIQAGTYVDTFFAISNIGSGVLTGYVGQATGDYEVISGGGSYSLAGGESHPVTVRFQPMTEGTHGCTIETGTHLCGDVSITGSAYECPQYQVLYVDADATGSGTGSSWTDAFTDLQDALARAELCGAVTQIWVAEGTYYPSKTGSMTETFQLRSGLAIYGGFWGIEYSLNQRNLFVNKTVLSGDIGIPGDTEDNSYHVVTGSGADETAVLDGFTITAGNAGGARPPYGGGMYGATGSPTLRNVIFADNAAGSGGGIYIRNGSNPKLINVVFIDNHASDYGGGMYVSASSPILVNATFARNMAEDGGGGMYNNTSSTPQIINTIMWGDSTAGMVLPEIGNLNGSNPNISYSLISDCGGSGAGWEAAYGADGGHNIEGDAGFVDTASGDLHLLAGSYAIDAGNNSAPGLPGTDIEGNFRIQNYTVDMGAYEGEYYLVEVDVATEPAGLDIVIDGETLVSPRMFVARSGSFYEIGTTSPQTQGETLYSFSGWSDAGAIAHWITVPESSVTYTASFTWAHTCASIDSIVDVPADQGGWARIHFRRSHYDDASETDCPIARYDIHRRVDDPELFAAIFSRGKRIVEDMVVAVPAGAAELLEITLGAVPSGKDGGYIEYCGRYFLASPPGLWEVVGTVSAAQQENYITLAPTLADSAATMQYTAFYISAHSTTPAVYFDSPADSGYSVDNIEPGVPLGFAVSYNTGSGNELAWDPSPEPDFQYYRIYRGDSEEFAPGPETLVDQTALPEWTDPEYDGGDVHYKVTAVDHAGNESDPASPGEVTGGGAPGLPKAFALYQNVPNPFNPSTVIRFDLPKAAHVRLAVYNVKGELVADLFDGGMTEGRKEIAWKGTDQRGTAVASGVYFYRLEAGDFVKTRKMVLLK